MWYFVGFEFKPLVISMSMEWGAHGREEKSYTPGIFAHRLYKISPPPMLCPTLFVEMTFWKYISVGKISTSISPSKPVISPTTYLR